MKYLALFASLLAAVATANDVSAAPTAPALHVPAGVAQPRSGVRFPQVGITKDNLYARVTQYTGALTIEGWTNGAPAAKFWSNVPLNDRPLQMDFTQANAWIQRCYNAGNCANRSTEWLGVATLNDNGKSIDQAYSKNFAELLAALETPVAHDIALKNYLHTGDNTINFMINHASANWSVTFELYTLSADGHIAVVQETHLDQASPSTPPPITVHVGN